jgi:hypothetical protein
LRGKITISGLAAATHLMTPTPTSAIERIKNNEAAESGGFAQRRQRLELFELGRNAGESRVHTSADGVDHGDDHSGDTRCDQAIFNRRCTRFIAAELN